MFWKADVVGFLRRIDDTICALFQRCFELLDSQSGIAKIVIATNKRDNLGRLRGQFMRKLLVVRN